MHIKRVAPFTLRFEHGDVVDVYEIPVHLRSEPIMNVIRERIDHLKKHKMTQVTLVTLGQINRLEQDRVVQESVEQVVGKVHAKAKKIAQGENLELDLGLDLGERLAQAATHT